MQGIKSDPNGRELEPFERQPDESDAAFLAFQRYRDMPAGERSIDLAYRASDPRRKRAKSANGTWNRWSVRHRWSERAAAYDAHLDGIRRRERERALVEEHRRGIRNYQLRQRKLAREALKQATALLEKAGIRLEELKTADIPAEALPQFFRAAAAVAEQATNAEAQSLAVGELLAELVQE